MAEHGLPQIIHALQIIHGPQSTNEERQQAFYFLEQAKEDQEAPSNGYELGSDTSQPAVVRHYGLSLLEFSIRHSWKDYSPEQGVMIQEWVVKLAEGVAEADPAYLRNKFGQLWVEITKRTWGRTWMNMDEMLFKLYGGSLVQKELCLFILETLSEEAFKSQDSHDQLTVNRNGEIRHADLSRACIQVFTPADILANRPSHADGSKRSADHAVNLRYGEDGWLVRLCDLVDYCLDHDVEGNDAVRSCAVKTIESIKAATMWQISESLIRARIILRMCRGLASGCMPVQRAALDVVYSLYSRGIDTSAFWREVVVPLYQEEAVDLLKRLYEWSTVDANDIDEEKYSLRKKLSEVVALLGLILLQRASELPEDINLLPFSRLLLQIASDPSLTVSISVLSVMVKIKRATSLETRPEFVEWRKPLLDLCTQRLLRFEDLDENLEDTTVTFLHEDIDTMPERHAFLGNYRKYCSQYISTIVEASPLEATQAIFEEVIRFLSEIASGGVHEFKVETYQKNSIPFLRAEAQLTVVEAALKSHQRIIIHKDNPQLEDLIEAWCNRVMHLDIGDPLLKKKIVHVLVAFSIQVLARREHLMLTVLEYILMVRTKDVPDYPVLTESIRELRQVCNTELQRIPMRMPDHLAGIYPQLEAKVQEMSSYQNPEDREVIAFQTFLFIINHRAREDLINENTRLQRKDAFLAPISRAWQNPELTESISTFGGFCKLLGLDAVQDYLVSRRAMELSDWSKVPLDDEGQAIQARINNSFKGLPLRVTKSFLAVSHEKLEKGSVELNWAGIWWHDIIQHILPNLLKFITWAHAFHNPAHWANLPDNLHPLVGRLLTDRFWQSGISSGSKDDFYNRVTGTKSTLEGFASSIRAAVRTVRESCYAIIYSMSRFSIHFFGITELPGPLAHALFADALALSSHQMLVLLNVSRYLVDGCPQSERQQFLPPVLATLLAQVDSKLSAEWDELRRRTAHASEDDDLTEEMKGESIIRQLENAAVSMVSDLLNPVTAASSSKPSIRSFVLSSDTILEPLMVFCTHALTWHDTRCCGKIIRAQLSIIPELAVRHRDEIREYICSEMLKTAITSIHDDYFVDVQRDLASLVAMILQLYSEVSMTPRMVLASLPGIDEEQINQTIIAIRNAAMNSTPAQVDTLSKSGRKGRSQVTEVLALLGDLRGKSLAEKWKIDPASSARKIGNHATSLTNTVSEKKKEDLRNGGGVPKRFLVPEERKSPELGGIADMFA